MRVRRFRVFNVVLTLLLVFSIQFYVIFYDNKVIKEETSVKPLNQIEKLENLRSFYIYKNLNFELKNVKFLQNVTNSNGDGDVLVILVQVHDRLENLKILIESLRSTTYISNAIIIFSQDLVDPRIDRAIEKLVDFAAVILYFYFISFEMHLRAIVAKNRAGKK